MLLQRKNRISNHSDLAIISLDSYFIRRLYSRPMIRQAKWMLLVFSVGLFAPCFAELIDAASRGGGVSVRGYTRKDGTYVRPHTRSAPDGNPYNNYSFPGNYNPNTGKTTGGDPNSYLERYYNRGPASSAAPKPTYIPQPNDYSIKETTIGGSSSGARDLPAQSTPASSAAPKPTYIPQPSDHSIKETAIGGSVAARDLPAQSTPLESLFATPSTSTFLIQKSNSSDHEILADLFR
jgi:hypothetical protein